MANVFWSDIQELFNSVGDSVGNIVSKLLSYTTLESPSKLISLIGLLSVAYFSMKLVQKPIKWIILGLSAFLILSVGFSLFNT